MMRRLTGIAAIVGAVLASLLVAACSPEPTPTPTSTPTPEMQEWNSILGTTLLRTGTQRVAFLLATSTDFVRVPEATVTTTFLDGGVEGETTTARFHEWPFGTRGSYVTRLTFPQAGAWRLHIEGEGGEATLDVSVDETSIVRDVGDIGVFSNTKTLQSADGDLASITSHYRPDPALYEISVAESLFNRKPTVVVFASPAFCTTPTCGPQVETVTELREAYPDAADYIHVEVYDNPREIQGDLTKGVLSPVLADWGIDQVPDYRNESWTFILGADARIVERFEGFATFTELEEALREVAAGA